MRVRAAETLVLSLLLAPAARAAQGRYVPSIDDDYQEEQQKDWTRDASKKHLPGLTAHLGDLISDQQHQSQDDVPGVDSFMDRLQEALKKNGSDTPRYDILRNAKLARDVLRDGYDDLRKALEPLLEARRLLRESGEILVPAVQGEQQDAGLARQGVQPSRQAADAMVEDRPDAPGGQADASAVDPIQPRGEDLKPIPDKLEQAGKKLEKAKPWVAQAKSRANTLDILAQKAKELEENVAKALGQRRTMGVTKSVDLAYNSEKVIRNANKWLRAAQKKAEKAAEKLEKETAPDGGLNKVTSLVQASDRANLGGQAADRRTAVKVNEQTQIILGIQAQYDQAKPEERPPLVAQAQAAKGVAQAAAERADKAAQKAEDAARAADEALQKEAQELKELEKLLGPEPPERQLLDLPEYIVDAPAPRRVATDSGQMARGRQESKPLRYPKMLDDSAGRVIGEYGERGYGTGQ